MRIELNNYNKCNALCYANSPMMQLEQEKASVKSKGVELLACTKETYSVEIIGNTAYVTQLKDSSDSHGLVKGTDFIGSREECKSFIDNSKNITEVNGF